MNTNFAMSGTLLEQAFHAGGQRTENERADSAFGVADGERRAEGVIALFNTVEYDIDYDYKKLRGKR
jgi:hypothetical protein